MGHVHLVHQTKPLASFDAVHQRRHHALRPDRGFGPQPPADIPGLYAFRSPHGHALHAVFALSLVIAHPPRRACLPSNGFCYPALSRLVARIGTMRVSCSSEVRTHPGGLPASFALLSEHPVPKHVMHTESIRWHDGTGKRAATTRSCYFLTGLSAPPPRYQLRCRGCAPW